ncbi:MAG: nitroreductase family protein, partial [Atopostipes suicloacalis]|nr:nitroreductase family protein [Atopostipes suicloacalis]
IEGFKEALATRRTYYAISDEKVVEDEKVQELIEHVVKHTPSAFNSQTARVVLLLEDSHDKLWEITRAALKEVTPDEQFSTTSKKVDAFKAGRGTILFFEDMNIVHDLQINFPIYEEKFPDYSKESSGMHQFNIWTGIELLGYGASLQHYTELIDGQVKKEFGFPANWKMRAQMPFGKPLDEAAEKEFEPLEERVKVYR